MEELSTTQAAVPLIQFNNDKQIVQDSLNEISEDSDSTSSRNSVANPKSKKSIGPYKKWALKRITPFSDSDNDSENACDTNSHSDKSLLQDDDSGSDDNSAKSGIQRKSRIQKNILSDSEESGSEQKSQTELSSGSVTDAGIRNYNSYSDNAVKNEEQQLRIINKRNKLKDKFKSLLTARNKEMLETNIDEQVNKVEKSGESSNESDEEMASIEKIKQKIKERMSFKPSICDPDTSDEESSQQKSIYKQKKERKTKLTSPKPQRMSAKQAMENMQKIKSESNRMLREKEVSLPYHRPKAISLKDIMSRRKLAVSSDGKTLPIKMNEEQLTHYAKMLEDKQKEMLELCKSESEEEEDENELNPENKHSNLENERDETSLENTTDIRNEVKNTTTNRTENSENLTKDVEIFDETAVETASSIKDTEQISIEQNSESIRLVYDDTAQSNSIDYSSKTMTEETFTDMGKDTELKSATNNENIESIETKDLVDKNNTDNDSHSISLHFDTENTESTIKDITDDINIKTSSNANDSLDQHNNAEISNRSHENPVDVVVNINNSGDVNSEDEKSNELDTMDVDKDFSDDDINMEDIDNIIENAEIIKNIEDKVNSQFLVRDKPLNLNPKLTGAPGMVIDLEDSNTAPRKSGVELLKERFTYFSKLKTPEEIEREREKKLKPGTQLKKLKQELEDEIAEQRSLEWAKRLEDVKLQQRELKVLRGEASDDDDDIDKIEAAIEGNGEIKEDSEESESGEEEPEENDVEIKDKPRKKNAMFDDEAVESECEEDEFGDGGIENPENNDENRANNDENQADNGENPDNNYENQDDESESDSESDSSSDSDEEQVVTKKGRILKAFEDSDEEDVGKDSDVLEIKEAKGTTDMKSGSSEISILVPSQTASQDDDIQLAQRPISTSDDLFASQESATISSQKVQNRDSLENDETFTQTFSILESSRQTVVDLNNSGISGAPTQSLGLNNVEDLAFQPTESQNDLPLPSQIPLTQSQSQPIGEDILVLCTGQFYNNQFVSQVENNPPPLANSINYDAFDNFESQDSQDVSNKDNTKASNIETDINNSISEKEKENSPYVDMKEQDSFINLKPTENKENCKEKVVDDNLKSILDELDDPEFDAPKPNKYFLGSDKNSEVQLKRKLVIDSDDETGEGDGSATKKRKKLKKKKHEKRALQISDDEEEQSEAEELEEYESDIEEGGKERLVEYDSEENEIEIKPQNPKKKRKMAEFFENEAELTSEDEWVGSGDEDEAGLDRMEREEGDDEVFHQGKLQKELGQIHMRDVLDQDKREVRLIQELLFEDGDLGGGSRQRKFKWSNMGEEETGTVPDEFADTQEEEFESEEQWRKQRHEREMFLRQMQNKDEPDESLNVSVNRTTIIKANLLSRTMSSILMEAKNSTSEKTETTVTVEKKTAKDIPSPKKPFGLLQASYQGSLLSRGRGALARLAALATPLAADDDAKVGTIGPTSRRNFVFAALTPEEKKPKVTKRKAENNPSTPNLVKKIRTEEKNASRSSLLDHFKL